MALTTLTATPSSVTKTVVADGPPGASMQSMQIDGNQSYTAAALSEPNGKSGWLIYPATCNHNTPFKLRFDFRGKRNVGKYTTTLRATKLSVTVDVVVTITLLPPQPPV